MQSLDDRLMAMYHRWVKDNTKPDTQEDARTIYDWWVANCREDWRQRMARPGKTDEELRALMREAPMDPEKFHMVLDEWADPVSFTTAPEMTSPPST